MGRGLAPAALSPQAHQAREGTEGAHTMTNTEYLEALRKLGWPPSSKFTALKLGLSVRQCQRIAARVSPVPEPVARLLRHLLADIPSASTESGGQDHA